MTDKEIIIDDVDVNGCYFLSKGITNHMCKNIQEVDEECKYNPNCCYKQLQRKEQVINEIEQAIEPYQEDIEGDALSLPGAIESILQRTNAQYNAVVEQNKSLQTECKELKEDYKELEQRHNGAFQDFERLKQECEELKAANNKFKDFVKNQMFDVDCVNWFERFTYCFDDWKKELINQNDRYKQALDEIEHVLKTL